MADIKIILVEDENIDAMDIKETLESFNYEVPYVASTGIEMCIRDSLIYYIISSSPIKTLFNISCN